MKSYQKMYIEIEFISLEDIIKTSTYDPYGDLSKTPDEIWDFDDLLEG